jgi:hypothetical protein
VAHGRIKNKKLKNKIQGKVWVQYCVGVARGCGPPIPATGSVENVVKSETRLGKFPGHAHICPHLPKIGPNNFEYHNFSRGAEILMKLPGIVPYLKR